MAPPTKIKDDDKIERMIRGLLKLPENRRCINCNSLGPQYVCTTFWTFVCTNCSGIHREFTHRIKSISMAKFSPEEASALQAGGNERARQIYFKEWDPQRHSQPDGSNLYRLRDFIKHVYVDRKYTGERSNEMLPRLKLTDKEEFFGSKSSRYRAGSRSTNYEDKHERNFSARSTPSRRSDDGTFKYYYDERGSPRYVQENSRSGGYRRNPVRFEVVDDRFRDDASGSGRRSFSQTLSNEESKLGSRSPDNQKSMDSSCVVHPGKDNLAEDSQSLQAGETLERSDNSADIKKASSSNKSGTNNGNAMERKAVNSESLIDISTESKPPDAPAEIHGQQMPPSSHGGNWASFESSTRKASSSSNVNTLEMLLLELAPATVNVPNMPQEFSSHHAQPTESVGDIPSGAPTPDVPTERTSAADVPVTSTSNVSMEHPSEDTPEAAPDNLLDSMQQLPGSEKDQPPLSPPKDESSSLEKSEPQTSTSPEINEQGTLHSSELSQTGTPLFQEANYGMAPQHLPTEPKSSGRKELPADLFSALYSPTPAPIQGCQTAPPCGMGFSMHYYPDTMPLPAYSTSAKSSNPFDFSNETNQLQGPTFPSMAPLQGTLPPASDSSGFVNNLNLEDPLPPSSSYATNTLLPFQSPSYRGSSPGLHMEQQGQIDMFHSSLQGFGGYGADPSPMNSLNANRQMTASYSAPSAPNSFAPSRGGNPFG